MRTKKSIKKIQGMIKRLNIQLFELDLKEEWDAADLSLYKSLVHEIKRYMADLKELNRKKYEE